MCKTQQPPYGVFMVNNEIPEYIIAQTAEEALADHNQRSGNNHALTLNDVEEIPLDCVGYFDQEDGTYREMTFREYIGEDFDYEKPICICWSE